MGDRRHEAGWLIWQLFGYLGRMLRPQLSPLLREVGMASPLEAFVCSLVHHAGGCRVVDIARSTCLPVSTVSDLTDRLVAEGLLLRRPHPHDRRSVVVATTERGAEACRWLEAAAGERLEGPLAALDDATLAGLTAGLRALAHALEQGEHCGAPGPAEDGPDAATLPRHAGDSPLNSQTKDAPRRIPPPRC